MTTYSWTLKSDPNDRPVDTRYIVLGETIGLAVTAHKRRDESADDIIKGIDAFIADPEATLNKRQGAHIMPRGMVWTYPNDEPARMTITVDWDNGVTIHELETCGLTSQDWAIVLQIVGLCHFLSIPIHEVPRMWFAPWDWYGDGAPAIGKKALENDDE